MNEEEDKIYLVDKSTAYYTGIYLLTVSISIIFLLIIDKL